MRKVCVLVGLVSAIGAMALGCDNGGGGEEDPILVGTITSLTGDLGELGPSWRDAAKLAVQEASAAGGLLGGRDLQLQVEDDRTSPDGGRAAATKLVELGVAGIIGCPASGSSLAAVEVTGPANVPQLSGTSTSPDLNSTDGGADAHPYFFRTVPADDLQGFVLASAAAGEYNDSDFEVDCQQLAVINIDNSYGNPFGDAIADRFAALGRTVVVDIDYPESQGSYADQVEDLLAATPDCIALVAYPESGQIIVQEYYSHGGADVVWFGTDGIKNEFFNAIPAAAMAEFYGTAPASDPTRRQLQAFNDLYSSTFGGDPQVLAETIYDASALLVLAIAQAGSTDGAAIRDALFEVSSGGAEFYGPGELVTAINAIQSGIDINYQGAGGSEDFLENGDVLADYEVWQYVEGSGFSTRAAVTADAILRGMEE